MGHRAESHWHLLGECEHWGSSGNCWTWWRVVQVTSTWCFRPLYQEMWLLSSLQGNIKEKSSDLILTLLHQFLSAIIQAVSFLFFVVFSTLQDSRDFWPWQSCWVWAFQKRTRQRFKDLLLLPTERKGNKIQNTSDGFGECKSCHKELFERSCRDQFLGQEEHLAAQAKQLSTERELSARDHSVRADAGHSLALLAHLALQFFVTFQFLIK